MDCKAVCLASKQKLHVCFICSFAFFCFWFTMEGMCNCIMQHGDFTMNCSHCQQGAHGDTAFHGPSVVSAMVSSSCCGSGTGGHRILLGSKSDVLLDNGNLNKLDVKHDSITHCLAPCPPSSADRETKSHLCEDTVVAIRNGGKEDWGVKTQFLCDHIEFPWATARSARCRGMRQCMWQMLP